MSQLLTSQQIREEVIVEVATVLLHYFLYRFGTVEGDYQILVLLLIALSQPCGLLLLLHRLLYLLLLAGIYLND